MKKRIKLIVFLIIISMVLGGCIKNEKEFFISQEETFALGTYISISIYDNEKVDRELFIKAFERIREIENLMTINSRTLESEILMINESAGEKFIEVSEETFLVIEKGLEYSKLTNGKFDITIEPLVKLWSIGFDGETIPNSKELIEAQTRVDFQSVILKDGNKVMLKNSGMGIDLGGIAKGYAADEVARLLMDYNVKSAVINLGGDIVCIGKRPDQKPFKIGLQNPFEDRGSHFGFVTINNKTIVTSGTYERFFEKDGIRYHHIIDIATGFPVQNDLESVTIISEKSIDADALSTGVFAMGLENGKSFVEKIEGVEAIFVTKDKNVVLTSNIDEIFTLTNNDFKVK